MNTFTAMSPSSLQSVLSGCVVALLIICVVIRAAVLRRRGIRAMVFGRTDKSDFLLVVLVLAIVYGAAARTLGLPMWDPLRIPFWASALPGWVGLAVCVFALVFFILTLASFGESFRVGIDDEKPAGLKTNGTFAISRNPLYLCFLLVLTGLFLIHRNIVFIAALVVFALAINRQVLREEKFLDAQYGDEYIAYKKKVRRYI